MPPKPSRPLRAVKGEEHIRYFIRKGIHYKVLIAWNPIADGSRYHYIHVYRGGSDLPFRYWRWWTDSDGNFTSWG